MYLSLILFNNIFSQFVMNCKKQSDCDNDSYCNILSQCKRCINIKYNLCDAMNGCCTNDFFYQCGDDKFNCNKNPSGLHLFLIMFIISSFMYLLLGSSYNKYFRLKTGPDVLPNIAFWKNLGGLVKDGIYFSLQKTNNLIIHYIY